MSREEIEELIIAHVGENSEVYNGNIVFRLKDLPDRILTLLDSEVVEEDCEDCGGRGYKEACSGIEEAPIVHTDCPTCKGTKKQTLGVIKECDACEGKGQFDGWVCSKCSGDGRPKGWLLRPLTWGKLPKAILEKWEVVRMKGEK